MKKSYVNSRAIIVLKPPKCKRRIAIWMRHRPFWRRRKIRRAFWSQIPLSIFSLLSPKRKLRLLGGEDREETKWQLLRNFLVAPHTITSKTDLLGKRAGQCEV